MGSRSGQRVKMVLPVRIWGMDTSARPFVHLAHTLDITRKGARVGGVRAVMHVGDIIGVQCRLQKARFKVMWMGKPGSPRNEQIGIEFVDGQKDIWGLELPPEVPDDYEGPVPPPQVRDESVRRRHMRHAWNGEVEVSTEGNLVGQWNSLNDISLGGCYVQTAMPLSIGTLTRLVIRGGDIEIRARAVVRHTDTSLGMSMEFIDLSTPEDEERLKSLIQRLASGEKVKTHASKPGPEVAGRVQKATADLRELEELIKTSDLDGRVLREFRESLGHVRNTAWAVQRFIELKSKEDDPFPVLTFLNTERMRLATHLCRDLYRDLQSMELHFTQREVDNLLRAVEDLFTQLAGLNFSIETHREDMHADEIEINADEPPWIQGGLTGSAEGKMEPEGQADEPEQKKTGSDG